MTVTVRPARANLQSFSALWRFEQGQEPRVTGIGHGKWTARRRISDGVQVTDFGRVVLLRDCGARLDRVLVRRATDLLVRG
jgi:hypothetical protein